MTTVSVASDDYSAVLAGLTSNDSTSTTSDAEELYTTWITLLATQLQNQDPTDPVDAAEFTSQLVSLSSLEQQAMSNDTLTGLLSAVEDIQGTSAYDYLGTKVTAYGDFAPLSDGAAEWSYDLSSKATDVTITVLDVDGNVVYTAEGDIASGSHDFTWDGTTDSGGTADDGAYQLVVEATNADGDSVSKTICATGTVTSVTTSGGSTVLMMDDVAVPLSYLISMSAA